MHTAYTKYYVFIWLILMKHNNNIKYEMGLNKKNFEIHILYCLKHTYILKIYNGSNLEARKLVKMN